MPFDANLVLVNGTTDWTEANVVGNIAGAPVTTSFVYGSTVIDLKAISGTPAVGLSVILIIDEVTTNDDALTAILQGSDQTDFTQDATNDVRTLATFDILGETAGIIVGDECPCTVIRRFQTKQRYVRIYATCVASDNFHTVYAFLAPWPFHVL